MAAITPGAWTPLRIFVLATAVLGSLFSIGCVVWWWRIPAPRRDGFELMGLALASIHFVALVAPALLIAWRGRWLGLGAVLGVVSIALASDVLFPWLPWR